jgi:hypothetical protein
VRPLLASLLRRVGLHGLAARIGAPLRPVTRAELDDLAADWNARVSRSRSGS